MFTPTADETLQTKLEGLKKHIALEENALKRIIRHFVDRIAANQSSADLTPIMQYFLKKRSNIERISTKVNEFALRYTFGKNALGDNVFIGNAINSPADIEKKTTAYYDGLGWAEFLFKLSAKYTVGSLGIFTARRVPVALLRTALSSSTIAVATAVTAAHQLYQEGWQARGRIHQTACDIQSYLESEGFSSSSLEDKTLEKLRQEFKFYDSCHTVLSDCIAEKIIAENHMTPLQQPSL